MGLPEPLFSKGSTVQRINQPESVGQVIDLRWDSQAESWTCIVQFGTQRRAVPETLLQQLVIVETPWDAMRAGQLAGADHFSFTLTFHRLKNPPARIAHSLATARTLFYPHQFKPLLKFLDNPGKRLLIADDVGLGKTIEAGYVLREIQAHNPVERVLIVVPARLAPKWKRELQSRFDEGFEIIKGADLIRQMDLLRRGREPDPFHWIISYESARSDAVREAIENTGLPIDVLIADESHRLRNPETMQHKVGAALCSSAADAVIFLSATPVQNKLEDLWNLLRLLSPDEFAHWEIFEQQMKANRYLLLAQRALAQMPTNFGLAQDALVSFSRQRSAASEGESSFLKSILRRLSTGTADRREIVELQADIGRLSPIGHILCRTRKVDALTDRSLREAMWKRITLSTEERDIYENVEDLCRRSWRGADDSWGFTMSLIMAYRVTASCIPVAMDYFRTKLSGAGGGTFEELVEEGQIGDGTESVKDLSAWSGPTRKYLQTLVDLYPEEPLHDSKFEELRSSLYYIWQEDHRQKRRMRKIVVFSFFRRTLEYLSRQLSSDGIANKMIHGLIPVAERESAIDEFLNSPDFNVLLTSEVGGEGLDLQKASVIINYDLPWNPMVVEQRIGRIDRIGQEAEKIIILNLVVADSIEERVLQRLFEKIRIFENSIGEMDEILGDEVEKLTLQALRGGLSEEQLQRVIAEKGDALQRRVHEAHDVLSRVDALLAADQALIDEINAVINERQIPAEREMLRFFNRFLADHYVGCQISSDAVQRVVEADLRQIQARFEVQANSLGPEAASFSRKIAGGPIPLTIAREAGYIHPRAEVIHLLHPLTRFALAEIDRQADRQIAAFAVAVRDADLPPGDYAFLVVAMHISSIMPSTRMVMIIVDRRGEGVWSDPEQTTPVLIRMLEIGEDLEMDSPQSDEVENLKERLLVAFEELRAGWDARERLIDDARREQQFATRQATLRFLVGKAEDRLNSLVVKGAGDFAVRMARARVEKARRELQAFLENPPSREYGGMEYEEIAVGFLRVGGRRTKTQRHPVGN